MQKLKVDCFDDKNTALRYSVNNNLSLIDKFAILYVKISYSLLGSTRSPSLILIRPDLCHLMYV